MATIEATWPVRSQAQVEDQAPHDSFESLKELLRMFLRGCFHWHKSRPFTSGRMTYRVCTDCGARRRFDLDRWEMYGPYLFAADTRDEREYELKPRALPADKSNVCLLRAA